MHVDPMRNCQTKRGKGSPTCRLIAMQHGDRVTAKHVKPWKNDVTSNISPICNIIVDSDHSSINTIQTRQWFYKPCIGSSTKLKVTLTWSYEDQ